MKRDGRKLAHNTLEEMRVLAVAKIAASMDFPVAGAPSRRTILCSERMRTALL
jgi:hypothetical protein